MCKASCSHLQPLSPLKIAPVCLDDFSLFCSLNRCKMRKGGSFAGGAGQRKVFLDTGTDHSLAHTPASFVRLSACLFLVLEQKSHIYVQQKCSQNRRTDKSVVVLAAQLLQTRSYPPPRQEPRRAEARGVSVLFCASFCASKPLS